jgi:hypothetical protein
MDPFLVNFTLVDSNMNCAIFISGGKLIIKESLITLG